MQIISWICLLFLSVSSLFPQDLPYLKLAKSITIDNGLIQSSVSSVVQDKMGYLWIGTHKGVCRWNGKEIITYTEENGLIKNSVRSLFCTSEGDVLVGTLLGVSVFSKNGLTDLIDPAKKLNDKIYAIYEMKDGTLVFGTENNGIVFKKKNEFSYLNEENGLVSNTIVAIIEDGNGNLIFGSRGNGISIYNGGKITNHTKGNGLVSARITSFLLDTDGSILIATNSGISRYNKNKFSTVYSNEGLSFVRGRNSFLGNDGTAYFVSYNSIYHLVNGVLNKVLSQDGTQVGFNCIYISENGTFFIGTTGEGLRIYKRPFVFSLNSNNGFMRENIFGISEDKTGNFYIATLGSGIALYNGGNKVKLFTAKEGLTENSFYSIQTASDNKTYFGSAGNGLLQYENGKISSPPLFNVFKNQRLHSIYEALDSSIFFCPPRSVWRLKNNKLIDFGKTIGLGDKKVDAVCNAKDGSLYFLVDKVGLIRLRNGELKTYNKDDGLTDYDFYSIIEGKNGDIYIGTDAGLFRLKNNKVSLYTKNDGLSENTIYSIVEDNSGKIYLGTNRGINVIDFSKAQPFITYLSKEDGFASNEFNEKAVHKDRRGRIWFGTVKGVSCYYPYLDLPQHGKPSVNISGFLSSGENIKIESSIDIDNSDNHLQINYEGIDIDSPEKIRFLYKLIGYQNEWKRSNSSSIIFDHLPAGNYTFEIVSVNNWNVKSDIASISFSIPFPLWIRWWMLTLYLILISSVIYYFLIYKGKKSFDIQIKKEIELDSLSKRENEIIQLLLEGESYKTIAKKMFISPATVQSHIKHIYKKLNIHSKFELFSLFKKEE